MRERIGSANGEADETLGAADARCCYSRAWLGRNNYGYRVREREGSPGASSSPVPLLAISALARSRMQLQQHGRRIIETGKRENIVAELVAFMPRLWPMEKTSKTVPRSLNFLQRRPTVPPHSLLENCSRLKTSRLFRKLRLRKRSFETSLRDGCSTSKSPLCLASLLREP